MVDYTWPTDLVPFASSFYLQPHTGGSESPFSRQSKIYGLSASRWACSLTLRAGRGSKWGSLGLKGARIDALLAKLKGRQNRVAIYDFDNHAATGALALATGNVAAVAGDSHLTITGMTTGQTVRAGSYIGGDERPHIILDDVTVDGSGHATVAFDPPLNADVALNAATFANITGWFRLTSDDAGQNFNEIGQLAQYSLQFVEDPGPTVDVIFDGDVVTYTP
jgi:hypothetical protein